MTKQADYVTIPKQLKTKSQEAKWLVFLKQLLPALVNHHHDQNWYKLEWTEAAAEKAANTYT